VPPYTIHYVSAGGQVVADVDDAGGIVRSYTYGPGIDNILAMSVHSVGETNTYYYIRDHVNTVLALVDDSGAIVESYEYDPFGAVTVYDENGTEIDTSAYGNRYLFQGREYSWDTGLYNFRARWYDPQTGRWLSKDPIGISGGLNQYVFVGNNPVNFVDPHGEFAIEAHQYWMDVAVAGQNRGGVAGNLQTAGASVMTSFIDFWGTRTLQGNAERSGVAAGEGRTAVAIGYGSLAVGQVALEAFAVGGAMESAKYSMRLAKHPAHHTFRLFNKKLPHLQVNLWKQGVRGSGKVLRIPLPSGSSASALLPWVLLSEGDSYDDNPCK